MKIKELTEQQFVNLARREFGNVLKEHLAQNANGFKVTAFEFAGLGFFMLICNSSDIPKVTDTLVANADKIVAPSLGSISLDELADLYGN